MSRNHRKWRLLSSPLCRGTQSKVGLGKRGETLLLTRPDLLWVPLAQSQNSLPQERCLSSMTERMVTPPTCISLWARQAPGSLRGWAWRALFPKTKTWFSLKCGSPAYCCKNGFRITLVEDVYVPVIHWAHPHHGLSQHFSKSALILFNPLSCQLLIIQQSSYLA